MAMAGGIDLKAAAGGTKFDVGQLARERSNGWQRWERVARLMRERQQTD